MSSESANKHFKCDLCNVSAPNEKVHVEGRKHQRKLNYLGPLKGPKKFYCQVCNVEAPDEEKHLKSNFHRKNAQNLASLSDTSRPTQKLKKIDHIEQDVEFAHIFSKDIKPKNDDIPKFLAREAVNILEEKEPEDIGEGDKLQDVPQEIVLEEVHKREKYNPVNDANSLKRLESYIQSAVCYFTVVLALDPCTLNFSIAVNVQEWKEFGHIVIKRSCKEKPETSIFAIGCRYVLNNPQNVHNLEDADINLEKEYKNIQRLKTNKEFNDTTFWIFTTHNANSRFSDTEKLKTKRLDIGKKLNEEDIYMTIRPMKKRNYILNMSNENDKVFLIYYAKDYKLLPTLFLYMNQRIHSTMVNDLIEKQFTISCNFFNKYKKYIGQWARGELGSYYFLTKKDVVLKICEIILNSYSLPRRTNTQRDNFDAKKHNFDKWNELIKKINVMIINDESAVLSKLCEPFNQIIEDSLSSNSDDNVKINPITNIVNITDNIIDQLDVQVKNYIFEVGHLKSDLHVTKLYTSYWKAGKIPLIIYLENNQKPKDYILDVISFMKDKGVERQFILKVESRPTFINIPKNITIFSCLDDVKHLVDLENLRVHVSDTFSLNLKDISEFDPFFLRLISPSKYFYMLLNMCAIKKDETVNKNSNNNLKILLDKDKMERVRHELYSNEYVPEDLGRLAELDPNLF